MVMDLPVYIRKYRVTGDECTYVSMYLRVSQHDIIVGNIRKWSFNNMYCHVYPLHTVIDIKDNLQSRLNKRIMFTL